TIQRQPGKKDVKIRKKLKSHVSTDVLFPGFSPAGKVVRNFPSPRLAVPEPVLPPHEPVPPAPAAALLPRWPPPPRRPRPLPCPPPRRTGACPSAGAGATSVFSPPVPGWSAFPRRNGSPHTFDCACRCRVPTTLLFAHPPAAR